tara:strand:- start:121 stop:1203 length:1083 start_codon:yes stop_codon:yes gene_type:complete
MAAWSCSKKAKKANEERAADVQSNATPEVKTTPKEPSDEEEKVKGPVENVNPPTDAPLKDKSPAFSLDALPATIATVDGVAVNAEAFRASISRYVRPGLKIPESRMKKVKSRLLDRLIDDTLISNLAKSQGVKLSDEVLAKEYEDYTARFKTEDHYANYLKHSKLTPELVKEQILVRVSLETILKNRGELSVTKEEAKKFFDDHPNLYQQRETVHAAHILIKVSKDAEKAEQEAAEKRIQEIHAELKKGGDFSELAKKHSEGPSKSRGGDLGFFGHGQMVQEFDKVAFSLEANTISEPVRTVFGWHIIKVLEKKEGRQKGFAEVESKLLDSLKRKKLAVAKRKLLSELRKQAKIERLVDF